MKKILTTIFSIISITLIAQVPQGIDYQAVATDINGAELVNQTISIKASVLSGSANGNIEWQETHAINTDTFGLFTIVIGQGVNTNNGIQTNFSEISWGANTHYLKIEMDVNGGSNYSFMGTHQMMSVPYALYGEDADADPFNELQTLSTSGDTIFISGSNYIVIPGIGSITCIYGCIDNGANNYDSLATCDDGSCLYPGCMDVTASNYNGNANIDDGSCLYPGCMDSTASNYNINANIDDNSCFWSGCMDSTACNYDPIATLDDASCTNTYNAAVDLTLCNWVCNYQWDNSANDSVLIYSFTSNGEIYNGSILIGSWTMCDSVLTLTQTGFIMTGIFNSNVSFSGTMFAPSPWSWIPALTGTFTLTSSCSGCTDNIAFNYDASALYDDGTCSYCVYGCIDPSAYNYNVSATCDDSSCVYAGCIDPNACNYNASATIDDGSCVVASLGWDCSGNVNDPQLALNYGSTIDDLLNAGVSMSSIYGLSYNGGYVFDYDQSSKTGKVIAPMDTHGWTKWNGQVSGNAPNSQYALSCAPWGNWTTSNCQCSQVISSSSGASNTSSMISRFSNNYIAAAINSFTDVNFVNYYNGTEVLTTTQGQSTGYTTPHWPQVDTTRWWQPDGNGGMEPIVTGYSDWYMTSAAEWQDIYNNIIANTSSLGEAQFKYGFLNQTNNAYWTSNEGYCNSIWPQPGKAVQINFWYDSSSGWTKSFWLQDRHDVNKNRMSRSFSE